jgi:hypothetical protein
VHARSMTFWGRWDVESSICRKVWVYAESLVYAEKSALVRPKPILGTQAGVREESWTRGGTLSLVLLGWPPDRDRPPRRSHNRNRSCRCSAAQRTTVTARQGHVRTRHPPLPSLPSESSLPSARRPGEGGAWRTGGGVRLLAPPNFMLTVRRHGNERAHANRADFVTDV